MTATIDTLGIHATLTTPINGVTVTVDPLTDDRVRIEACGKVRIYTKDVSSYNIARWVDRTAADGVEGHVRMQREVLWLSKNISVLRFLS